MFSFTSSSPTTPIFSPSDLHNLIQTFPPPSPTPGRESLIRSRSGKNLVRSNSVTKRFLALLETSEYDVLVRSLPLELGVQDVQWLFEQEAPSLFFTRDGERILTRSRQKGVVNALRKAVDGGKGVNLSVLASKSDISLETLTRLIKADAVVLELLEDGLSYDSVFLASVRIDLLRILREARDDVVDVGRAGKGLPESWIAQTSRQIVADNSDTIEGTIERRVSGVFFTPSAAQSLLQKQSEEATRAQVANLVQGLDRDGYCSVPDASTAVMNQVKQTWEQMHSEKPLVHPRSVHSAFAVLIQKDTLTAKGQELCDHATTLANQVWDNRKPGEEIVFSEPTFLASLEADPIRAEQLPLYRLILENDLNATSLAFTASITNLTTSAAQALAAHIRFSLLTPLTLYTTGLATIKDESLHTRVADHVFEHLRRTLIPDIITRIRTDRSLAPATKSSLRALDKFDNAVKDAKTIAEVTTAATKLGRYHGKAEQLDAAALRDCKTNLLRERVDGMRKMKRASDLLQNLIWVLLATSCGREGVFLSGGKDTSRMVKLAQSDLGERDEGKKLGELRDLIKEGKDGDVERAEMREVAKKALGAWESA